jgi:hypothetical protein
MKLIILTLVSFLVLSCKDNKRIIEESKQKAHADSAKIDSLKFLELKKEDEKIEKDLSIGKHYSLEQLDSIVSGGQHKQAPKWIYGNTK